MWIAFHLAFAALAFVLRLIWRPGPGSKSGLVDGRAYYERIDKQKNTTRGFRIGLALEAPLTFRLHRETELDRFFKVVGLSTELETGDPAFDDLVYVVCDHAALAALLKQSRPARDAIRAVLEAGYQRISFDGHVLWIRRKSHSAPMERDTDLLAALARALAPLERTRGGRFADPFWRRALLVEGLVWSIAGYGLATLVTLVTQHESVHLDEGGLVLPGLGVGAALLAILLGLTVALLRGSSRGHRMIFESAIVLLLGLPPVGIQAFADANRGLDSLRVSLEVPLRSCDVRVHRDSKGRTSTTRHLLFAVTSVDGVPLPREVKTNAALCDAASTLAQTPRVAHLTLGRGRFGHAWIRELRIDAVRWSPD